MKRYLLDDIFNNSIYYQSILTYLKKDSMIKHLTLLLFIGLARGQIDTLWTKIYGDTGSVPESGHYIKETQDGGYIVLGKNNQHLWLFKTDQNGIQEWSQLFGDTSEVSIGNSLIQIY